jgi:hypothetical protein
MKGARLLQGLLRAVRVSSIYTDGMSSAASRTANPTALAFAAALWTACVGDSPNPTTGPGDYGSNCFADGKCKEGLVCVQGTSCLRPGESVEGGAGFDAGSERSPNPDLSEGGTCEPVTSTDQFFDCPLDNGQKEICAKATKACCPGTGCVDLLASCPGGINKYGCMATPSCLSENKICCIAGAYDPTPACGLSSVLVPTPSGAGQCTDPLLCNEGIIQLCTTGSDCIIGECVPTAILANGRSFVVKTCK